MVRWDTPHVFEKRWKKKKEAWSDRDTPDGVFEKEVEEEEGSMLRYGSPPVFGKEVEEEEGRMDR